MALERLVFYSSLPCGRAKQIVPALFSKILWDACEIFPINCAHARRLLFESKKLFLAKRGNEHRVDKARVNAVTEANPHDVVVEKDWLV
jgi:hypothetical protein